MLAALGMLSSPCFAAGQAAQPPAAQTTAPGTAATVPQGPAQICLDVPAGDALTREFADRLRESISASGSLSLASSADSCTLRLHVPGNLLRFETQGGVMVGTVVIVTSASGHYLSASVTACEAAHLKPCAVRAIAAAKLALVMRAADGTWK